MIYFINSRIDFFTIVLYDQRPDHTRGSAKDHDSVFHKCLPEKEFISDGCETVTESQTAKF